METRSAGNDERITYLETSLKEAKYAAEDADRKYEEVGSVSTGCVGKSNKTTKRLQFLANGLMLLYKPSRITHKICLHLKYRCYEIF